MNTCGGVLIACPGSAAFTSFQLSSAGSFLKLSGSVPAGVQGPFTSVAFSHDVSLRRYSTLDDESWNRSQFVLTANFRLLSLIVLQIGSPSMLTITAGVLLKKIGGGSAFTPSTFFGTIWLLSRFASTRSSAITRSSSGSDLSMSDVISLTFSFGSVGKFASTIFMFEKLTSRSATATFVSASSLTVPSAGLSAVCGRYDTAL